MWEKLRHWSGNFYRATPEYDDLRRIAAAKKLPLKVVHDQVMRDLGK